MTPNDDSKPLEEELLDTLKELILKYIHLKAKWLKMNYCKKQVNSSKCNRWCKYTFANEGYQGK